MKKLLRVTLLIYGALEYYFQLFISKNFIVMNNLIKLYEKILYFYYIYFF